jgi:predicted nucleic acid-binding protein
VTDGHERILVFDEGPLSHFAEAGWLGLLELVVDGGQAWLPDTVQSELSRGVDRHPHLRQVLSASWLTLRTVGPSELVAFAFYNERLVDRPPVNTGECGVLALAEVNAAVAVIDDGAARALAEERGVAVKTTVSLLCDLVLGGYLSLAAVERVADNLLRTEYRLPFGEGKFRQFVVENGYLDPYG